MLFAAGIRRRHIALLGLGGLAVGAFYAWSAPYRRGRLLSFRDPFAKMSDEGYQLSQSLIALGSGGLFGMGWGRGGRNSRICLIRNRTSFSRLSGRISG